MANGSSPESSPDSSSGDSPASSPPPPPPSSNNSSSSAPPPSDSDKSPPPPQSLTPPPPSSDHDSGSQSSPPPPENSTAASPPPPPEAPATIVRSPPPPSAIRVFSPPPPVAAGSSGSQNGSTAAAENSTYVSPESSPDSRSVASSSSSSSKAPVEIGVLVAFGAIMLLMMVVCLVCCRRKKKKRHDLPPYGWGPAPPGEGQYWQSTHQEHAVKIHPPTGMVATWGSPNPNPNPTPSPHTTNSGEMSGPYSGSHGTPLPPPTPNLGLGFNKSTFSYEELAAATNGFAQANMLGQGGFGFVHKGVLPNGKEVAVKSLKSGSGQGEREFQSEVDIISRVHHRHLVSLVGYCIAGGQRMLVYEFVANNNLEYHLHKRADPPLDCSTRYRIALGSAKGLAYLHEDCHPRIIHRDIKAANILLDENFEAMVADFGLAKLTTDTNTHVSTRVMGTFGYLAPEYASSGKLTEKSDVFSFGVMLLELITGRRPVDANMKYMEDSLVDWARPVLAKAMEDHNYDQLADPRFERNYNTQEMARMVACAAASIRHSAKKRPKMSQIVRALEGDVSLDDLNEGTKPGQSTIYGLANSSSDYDANAYSADLKKFRQMAFATQDFGSEYGTTSEYGLNASSSSDDSREMRSKQF